MNNYELFEELVIINLRFAFLGNFINVEHIKNVSKYRLFQTKYISHFPESNLLMITTDLEQIPESVTSLESVKKCMIWGSDSLISIPKTINNLENLVQLSIIFCDEIKTLPDSIGKLHNLKTLIVHNNPNLRVLPESIGDLSSIIEINIQANNLEYLPESIGNLRSLEYLDVNRNKLKFLPNLENLVSLKGINLADNKFTGLPFFDLPNLKVINVKNNPLSEIIEIDDVMIVV